MDLQTALVNRLREVESAARKAVEKYDATIKRYSLSEEGKKAERRGIFNEAAIACEESLQQGLAAIDEKIEELNRQEEEAAQLRALDTEYLQRLNTKVQMLSAMDLSSVDFAVLKEMLREYENDSVAAALLDPLFPEKLKASSFMPKDNTGKRQEHLDKVVRNGFIDAVNRASLQDPDDLADLAKRAVYGAGSALEGFIQYVQHQNEDFSRDDMEVWKEIRDEGNPYTVEQEGKALFNFHFRNVHTGKYN